MKNNTDTEINQIFERYKQRNNKDIYDFNKADVYMNNQERERKIIQLLNKNNFRKLSKYKLLDVGSGHGSNFLRFLKYGFSPTNMTGIELHEERNQYASSILPSSIKLISGNALDSNIEAESFDIISQFVVFSSILDDSFQEELAQKMWEWLKPGGIIIWYDFHFNNPKNKDVRAVTRRRVRELFPYGKHAFKSVTLAPPISRPLSKISDHLYTIFNIIPFLRTHTLGVIKKSN